MSASLCYFLSDVHLRPDRPERDRRLERFAARLAAADRVFVLGDLCDFWFVARRRPDQTFPALERLARFTERGGELTIIAGNHDAGLTPFYQNVLGARVVPDRLELTLDGCRFFLAHGHRVSSRRWWKHLLETRAFLTGFRLLPRPLAAFCDRTLIGFNDSTRSMENARHLQTYRALVCRFPSAPDVLILGHSHFLHDEMHEGVRLIVLDSWYQRANWLTWDGRELRWTVECGEEPSELDVPAPPCPAGQGS